jgi:LmbE family N-acetylglucosaminyl deacetylase
VRAQAVVGASALVTRLWTHSFDLAGRLATPLRRWSLPGGRRILVVASHPDDEAIGCAGTILLHRRAGDSVCIAHVTDGSASRALGLDAETMRRRRRTESELASRLLAVERFEWLGLREGEWTPDEGRAALRALVTELAPDVCYAPSRLDYHPEHVRVAEALASVLPDGTLARIYPVHVPLLGAVNLVADVSLEWPGIDAVVAAYVTQAASTARAARVRRYAAALYGCERAGETFWELPAAAYRAMHSFPGASAAEGPWRGLRERPWTDPLAYLRGARERQHLARSLDGSVSPGRPAVRA